MWVGSDCGAWIVAHVKSEGIMKEYRHRPHTNWKKKSEEEKDDMKDARMYEEETEREECYRLISLLSKEWWSEGAWWRTCPLPLPQVHSLEVSLWWKEWRDCRSSPLLPQQQHPGHRTLSETRPEKCHRVGSILIDRLDPRSVDTNRKEHEEVHVRETKYRWKAVGGRNERGHRDYYEIIIIEMIWRHIKMFESIAYLKYNRSRGTALEKGTNQLTNWIIFLSSKCARRH